MRIASFNLENLSDEAGVDAAMAERIAVLRPQLERINADVLCLQEVDSQKKSAADRRSLAALDILLTETPYRDFHRVSTTRSEAGAPRDKHNLVVLSRWPIAQVSQYANSLVAPIGYRYSTAIPAPAAEAIAWDRPILVAAIALPGGRKLHVVNMHLKAPLASFVPGQKIGPFAWKSVSGWAEGYFVAAIKRSGQALEARLAVERIFDEDPQALIAVCGDFNAEEREMPFRILAADTEDTGNGQLAARELLALEHSLPDFRRFTVIHAGRKLMLDHILVSRPLIARYRGMEVHNEALGDEVIAYALVQKTPESYHAPVVAIFDFAPLQ